MPRRMVKQEIASTSSTLAAAITRVGIPLSTPQPCSWRLRRQGTTTAGDTAARTNPSMNPQVHGRERRRRAAIATTRVSTRHGQQASLRTTPESFLRAAGSRPKPALSRMTASATERTHEDQAGSKPRATSIPGTLFSTIPVMSIPSRGGSLTIWTSHPATQETRSRTRRAKRLPPWTVMTMGSTPGRATRPRTQYAVAQTVRATTA